MALWILLVVLLVGILLWWRGKSVWRTIGMWAVIVAGAYIAYELIGKRLLNKGA